jgi:small subunit ribosomal protein S3
MGRKVHPYGFRLGIIKPWRARWYAGGKEYGELLLEDIALRKMVSKEAAAAGIAEVTIERFPRQVNVTIHAAKPGIIIGRKGAAVNLMRDQVKSFTGKTAKVDVVEIRQPDANAMIIAQSVAGQLERRISHKRAMKQAATKAMRAGAKGVKIVCSGRLGGSDMSRTDQVLLGRVPRQTLRADIDYARFEAVTTFSVIGVKCWIYKGEVLPGDDRLNPETQEQSN